MEDVIDALEEKWDNYSVSIESSFKKDAADLKLEVTEQFDEGIYQMRIATDEQIRPAVEQGFNAISDGFNYVIDDAVDGFGEVLIA